ncbi:dtdp-glucose 4-6-dehydratase, putative, partial [Ixodes scapularis]
HHQPSGKHLNPKDAIIASMESKLRDLEARIKKLENTAPKDFPLVRQLDYRDKKRILVAGGAGFVGSHLVDVLMQQGHQVTVLDNFFTGSKRNIEHWLGHHNFELIHHDIVNPFFIEVDFIYNLASPASPPHYMLNPVKTIKTNTLGTINMLGLARRVGARLLITSTSEVYGDPEVHPQHEDYWGHVNPIGPRSCYDEGKRVAESLCYAYQKQVGTEIKGLHPDFLELRLKQNLAHLTNMFSTFQVPYSHRSNMRVIYEWGLCACSSAEHVYSLPLNSMISCVSSVNFAIYTGLINVVAHTIEDFAKIIKTLVGGTSKIVYTDKVEDDPQRRRPDITRAKTELKWEPKVELQDGLKKTVEYFREELNKNSKSFRNPPSVGQA